MKIHEVLHKMQKELKVPKGNYNSFGKYKYRSCEDIVEAIKEIMPDGYALRLSDEIIMLGDRFYIKAQAELFGAAGIINAFGYARESLDKKGMDDSQITGTASSYARKYALNGLFAIDDTKDADTDEYKGGIKGGLLDTETRDDAKLEFLKQISDNLDKVKDFASLDTALTHVQKDYLKNKLSKTDPIAYANIKNRYAQLEASFKEVAAQDLQQKFEDA